MRLSRNATGTQTENSCQHWLEEPRRFPEEGDSTCLEAAGYTRRKGDVLAQSLVKWRTLSRPVRLETGAIRGK